MSEFSIKKPFTVLVAVIAILVLGVVSYTKMTPDLLPIMDFPYVIIVTAYPGANPEQVEQEITRPMEQSMATLEHIKEITSVSSENSSMVMLEFEDSVNMDTIGVDIQQNINSLSAVWDEMIQTPYVLKINPSMLPVEVAGVSMQGKTNLELTEFLDETLLNELEGIPGVARISTTGAISQQIHVVLDQKKLDGLNEKIRDEINAEIDDSVQELKDQEKELKSAKDQINAARKKMNDAKKALSSAVDSAGGKAYQELKASADALQDQIDSLEAAQTRLKELDQQIERSNTQLETARKLHSVLPSNLLAMQIAELEGTIVALETEKSTLQTALIAQGLDPATLGDTIAAMKEEKGKLDQSLKDMAALGDGVKNIGNQSIDSMGSQITQSSASIDSAMEQIEDGYDAIEEGREQALKQADITNIITMDMVSQILTAQSFAMPAGFVEQDNVS